MNTQMALANLQPFLMADDDTIIEVMVKLDYVSLENARKAVPRFNMIAEQYSSYIYKVVAIKNGYTSEKCTEDGGLVNRSSLQHYDPFNPSLQDAILAQHAAPWVFRGIDTWEKFVKVMANAMYDFSSMKNKHLIIPSSMHTLTSTPKMSEVDNEIGLLISLDWETRKINVNKLNDRQDLVCRINIPNPYTLSSFRYSQGYIVFLDSTEKVFCFRRKDISDQYPQRYGTGVTRIRQRPSIANYSSLDTESYVLDAVYNFSAEDDQGFISGTTNVFLIFKFPELLVVNSLLQAKIFNVVTKSEIEEFSIDYSLYSFRGRDETINVEFDQDYLFVQEANRIRIYDRNTKIPVSVVPMRFHHNIENLGWKILYFDYKRKHLICMAFASETTMLLWIPNYPEYIKAGHNSKRHCVVLDLNGLNQYIYVQKYFDYILFGSHDMSFFMTFRLQDWDTVDNFKPPQIKLIHLRNREIGKVNSNSTLSSYPSSYNPSDDIRAQEFNIRSSVWLDSDYRELARVDNNFTSIHDSGAANGVYIIP